MKRVIYFISLLMILNLSLLHAQTPKDSINNTKLYIIAGASTAAFIYGYAVQNTIWWKGSKSKFHSNFKQDWEYALGSDKFGHFFFGISITRLYSHALMWSGMSEEKALYYSGIVALSYQTFIEIRDGFSKDYGFSWGDFAANLMGAIYPNLQYRYPYLKNFNFKLSFYPSERFKQGYNKYILDDYESTYNWLSINFRNFLPDKIRNYIPPFINIAIGHSVKKLNLQTRHHEFFLALDWDFSYIKTENHLLKFLKSLLGLYHLPSPAVQIYPDVIWYGIKF